MSRRKREWGRRRADNQPYPKTLGKEALPRGLTEVTGTTREPSPNLKRRMDNLYESLRLLALDIQMSNSREEAENIYTNISNKFGEGIADIIWDELVDWEHVTWGTADVEHDRNLGIPVDSGEYTGEELEKMTSIKKGSMIPLETAKNLSIGTILYSKTLTNADGTPQRWKVNGRVQRWARDPDRIKIPIKRGLREFNYFTNDNLGDFTLTEANA